MITSSYVLSDFSIVYWSHDSFEFEWTGNYLVTRKILYVLFEIVKDPASLKFNIKCLLPLWLCRVCSEGILSCARMCGKQKARPN